MFEGFSGNTIKFLQSLEVNNNKEWFETNREDYQKYLLGPFQELVKELGLSMLSIDPYIEINPKKCISRIHRDIRFSKDKSPYRANMWLAFKRMYMDWKTEPTYFFEIFPDYYRYGMGFYDVPKETMDKLRELILENNEEFEDVHSIYKQQKIFIMEGEKYKRVLNGTISDELKEWYQRKEVYFVCNRSIDDVLFGRGLITELIQGFNLLSPVYNFFLRLRDRQPADA
jgi:uncharacterized protein (TIGR02453 family)